MDIFKKITLCDYGIAITDSHEYGKRKIQKDTKKYLRKLSRTRLKRRINKDTLY